MLAPMDLLAVIAQHVTAETGLPAAAGHALVDWRDGDDPYVVVTLAIPVEPELRGDGRTLVDTMAAQVSLFERIDDEDPARVTGIVTALDAVTLPGHAYRGVVEAVARLRDPDSGDPQHALTVRYRAARGA